MTARGPESYELAFEASAYLQTLIGRELFRSQDFALVELIKNSYDSGASEIVIDIRPRSSREPGQILITDDGSGMALEDFKRVFMVAGYSERPDQVSGARRVPTGEKGIGRFATDRLGSRLEILTKTASDDKALVAKIDWTDFQNRKKKFHDVTLAWRRESAPQLPRGKGGTVLRIEGLREDWTPSQVRSLRIALSKLLDPLNPPKKFSIVLAIDGHATLSGPIVPFRPVDADVELAFEVLADGRISRALRGLSKAAASPVVVESSAEAATLAGLRGTFLYFLKRPTKISVGGLDAGVRIYRDGFRVEPLGTEAADWLRVAEKRAKRAGHAHVVPSRLFGFVAITRRKHGILQDTTGREALLDNDAARALVTVLREQVAYLEDSIRTAVAEPRWKQARAEKAKQFERERLHSLSIVADGLAHELRQPLQTIRSEADNIRQRLNQLGIADEDVAAAQTSIDENVERIDRNIRFISQLSSGDLISAEDLNLAEAIRAECSILQTRCSALGITLHVKVPAEQPAHINRTAVTMILMNLITNSMDALSQPEPRKNGRITVELARTGARHQIQVTDNGPGIPDDIRPKVFRRFASKKTGGSGVGLYNCRTIARASGGDITFESRPGVGTTFVLELPNERP